MRRSQEELEQFVAVQAERMKREPTSAEAKLWEHLKPLGFMRQVPLYGRTKNGKWWHYIVDFLDPSENLAVEVDGGYHKKQKGRDRRRDTRLLNEGVRTIRLTNQEVEDHIELTVNYIRVCVNSVQVTA